MNVHKNSFLLAVDPGTNTCGVALFSGKKVVEAFTVKRPVKSTDSDVRAYHIIREIEERLSQYIYCDQCDECHVTLVYEDPQYQRRGGGGHFIEPVYRMAGMLSYWGIYNRMPVFRYKVSDIKARIAGSRGAKKDAVEAVVRVVLSLKDDDNSDHVYDAMSVALYHLDLEKPGCFGSKLPIR